MIEKSFGGRLKELRLEKNISQQELGNLLLIARSSISKYEQNIQFPDFPTLIKISEIFNVSVDYLLCKSDFKTEDLAAIKLLETFEKAGITRDKINLKLLDKVLKMYKIMEE